MKYLEPASAVGGFLASVLEAVEIPRPDGSGNFSISTIEFRRIRKLKSPQMPAAAIIPGRVTESERLGDGRAVFDTADKYSPGTELVDFGQVEVPWKLIGVCQSEDVCTLTLAALRSALRSSPSTDAFADWFDRPVSVWPESFELIEDEEEARLNVWTFEIRGRGETADVELQTADTGVVVLDLTIE